MLWNSKEKALRNDPGRSQRLGLRMLGVAARLPRLIGGEIARKGDVVFRLSCILGMVVASMSAAWGQSGPVSKIGYATSQQQFVAVQESLRETVPLNAQATFVYCVCEADRGKIIYAYAFSGLSPSDVLADCLLSAQTCGGCFKPPITVSLGPSPRRIQEVQREREEVAAGGWMEIEDSDGIDDPSKTRSGARSRFRRGRDD